MSGASEMREAAAKIAECAGEPYNDPEGEATRVTALDIARKIRALPAPEVPGEVRSWVRLHMGTSNGDSLHDRLERFVRDWIRKEFQV